MKKHKIETNYNARYYAKHWLELFDGGSDQWLYVCRDGLTYVFLEIIDLPGYMGRDAQCRWGASVSVVDLLTISPDAIAGAMRCCGYAGPPLDFRVEADRLQLAEMCFTCGNKATLWCYHGGEVEFDDYGNATKDYGVGCPHFRRLRKEARQYGEELLRDSEARDRQLDTLVVNTIGSTAREFMGGDIWSALRRIRDDDAATPEQKLVLRMYRSAGQTFGAGPVPDDLA